MRRYINEGKSIDVSTMFNDWCHYVAHSPKSKIHGKIKAPGGKGKRALYTHWQEEKIGAKCSISNFNGYFIQCDDECYIHFNLN